MKSRRGSCLPADRRQLPATSSVTQRSHHDGKSASLDVGRIDGERTSEQPAKRVQIVCVVTSTLGFPFVAGPMANGSAVSTPHVAAVDEAILRRQ